MSDTQPSFSTICPLASCQSDLSNLLSALHNPPVTFVSVPIKVALLDSPLRNSVHSGINDKIEDSDCVSRPACVSARRPVASNSASLHLTPDLGVRIRGQGP